MDVLSSRRGTWFVVDIGLTLWFVLELEKILYYNKDFQMNDQDPDEFPNKFTQLNVE